MLMRFIFLKIKKEKHQKTRNKKIVAIKDSLYIHPKLIYNTYLDNATTHA